MPGLADLLSGSTEPMPGLIDPFSGGIPAHLLRTLLRTPPPFEITPPPCNLPLSGGGGGPRHCVCQTGLSTHALGLDIGFLKYATKTVVRPDLAALPAAHPGVMMLWSLNT